MGEGGLPALFLRRGLRLEVGEISCRNGALGEVALLFMGRVDKPAARGRARAPPRATDAACPGSSSHPLWITPCAGGVLRLASGMVLPEYLPDTRHAVNAMRRWAHKVAVILASGYVMFFYSERMFWSFWRPGDRLADLGLTWIVYSVLAWVVLLLVRRCRISTFPALFLAGAVYGWLGEGVVVDTLYGNSGNPFPASISFTGLAWHALISVGVGWYWQAKVLISGSLKQVGLFAVAVGLGWGLWAGWWPAELGAAHTSLAAFARHTSITSVLLLLAWLVLTRAGPDWFRPGRYELPVLLGVSALFFLGVRVPATPRSIFILPPLLLACAYGLRRNRGQEQGPDLLQTIAGQIRPRACLPLLLMPVTAIAVYAPVPWWGVSLPTNWVVYVVTMPLGFVFLIRSLWILHRVNR
jgi:hypothetical protein